ncbi:hypothetical protein HK097_002603 [Rhizophlyctis rosea]|uniref:Uncharacterized protein n=1 Tax=Rhizophlyctis rosea TaxID=64517 RepID=A0AAD5X745_9FUNG|nr:hypothetical protein HK097_002603 [Rhizophlyctis rosea]
MEEGVGVIGFQHDNTLQIVDGRLSVKPIIRCNNDYDICYKDPVKVKWDEDGLGRELFLDYEEDDFNSQDGKLKTVDLNLVPQGAVKIRKADWSLGEDNKKLRVIRLDVPEDLQQTGGVLAIRNQGPGRVPYFQIGSGITSNSQFSFDGATTLSVPLIKLITSFLLTDEYAASIGFVHYAYQASVETGLDILQPINNARRVQVRCDPSSLYIDAGNNVCVKTDPSGAMKRDVSLGLDLKIDPLGAIKLDPGLGIDVKLDPSGVVKNYPALGLDVKVDPTGGLKKDVGLGLDV